MVERDTPEIFGISEPPAVPASVAARRAGVSNPTMRRWLADGIVDGYVVQRKTHRRHYVFNASLDELLTRSVATARSGTLGRDEDAVVVALPPAASLEVGRASAIPQQPSADDSTSPSLDELIVRELLEAANAHDADDKVRHLSSVVRLQQKLIARLRDEKGAAR